MDLLLLLELLPICGLNLPSHSFFEHLLVVLEDLVGERVDALGSSCLKGGTVRMH